MELVIAVLMYFSALFTPQGVDNGWTHLDEDLAASEVRTAAIIIPDPNEMGN
jgi:hypothetical protein